MPSAAPPSGTTGVIQQFGLLVRNMDDALRAAGKAFNEVKDKRTSADYDETIVPSPAEAREALLAAGNLLEICGDRYGLRPPSP